MSLDTVVEDVREEARERAEEIRERREQEVERTIEQEREQRLSSAKLEAKQNLLEARKSHLESVRASVEEAVADVDGETREELTRAMLDAGVEEFDDEDDVRVYGRADDEELLRSLLSEYDGAAYAGEYDCLGGVVLESEGSRIRVNNTFDTVLDDVWDDNLRDVSARLFGEQ